MISLCTQYFLLPLACLSTIASATVVARTEPAAADSCRAGAAGTPLSSPIVPATVPTTRGFHNAAYFVNWAGYARNYSAQQLPVDKLTHVLYAFANLHENGTVYLSDVFADIERRYPTDSADETGSNAYGHIKQLYLLKKHNRRLKTLLSIGGWTFSKNFAGAASTKETRTEFAKTSVKLLQDLGFDGLDIDWEYAASEEEGANFVLLLQAIREELDAYAKKHAEGYHFLLTVASPAGPKNYELLSMPGMDAQIDIWHLMSFDYAGSWDNITGHMANLYPSVSNPASTQYSTDKAVRDYISRGATPGKIVLGLPLYGRAFENTNGIGLPYSGIGNGSWENGVWDYKVLPRNGAEEYYDAQAVGAYTYDNCTRELVTHESVESARTKVDYVKSQGLRGAFFWESSADGAGKKSIISTTSHKFGHLEKSENWLDYGASAYANLAAGMPNE